MPLSDPEFEQPEMFDMPSGPQFVESERVGDVATRLINAEGNFLVSGLRQAVGSGGMTLTFLENTRPFDQLVEMPVCGVLSKAIKAGAVWRDLAHTDAVLWIRSFVCDTPGLPGFLESTIFHALLHFECAFDKGVWKIALRPHDVEAFNETAGRYGKGLPDVRRFLQAAAKGETPTETGVQTEAPITAAEEAAIESLRELGAEIDFSFNPTVPLDPAIQARIDGARDRQDRSQKPEADQ